MFRLRWNDVPVAVEGMADRLVDGLVDIPFWGASVSLYIVGIQRVAAKLIDMVDIFAKHFFIMFAEYHFIIEWCLADKILPQIAQIGTDIGRRRIWQKNKTRCTSTQGSTTSFVLCIFGVLTHPPLIRWVLGCCVRCCLLYFDVVEVHVVRAEHVRIRSA